MSYIGEEEFIYTNNPQEGIHSGGFSVKSIMMKGGMSPIMTLNTNETSQKGGTPQVSDLFNDLVIPSWILSYNQYGGEVKKQNHKNNHDHESDSESDSSDVIDDDLHDKLLNLVRHHDNKQNKKNKITKSKNKMTSNSKKGGNTKKRR